MLQVLFIAVGKAMMAFEANAHANANATAQFQVVHQSCVEIYS